MDVEIRLDKFSGPLDLLLHLISEEKLDIGEIALSKVTEQYLLHLDTLEERRAEDLADFLVIGARLLLIKSRQLMPQFGVLPDEDGPALEDQLRLYKLFLDASKKINKFWDKSPKGYFREEPPRRPDKFLPPNNFDLDGLRTTMLKLILRLTPPKALPETKIDKTISLKHKIDYIRTLLGTKNNFNFRDVVSAAANKTEIIVSFLAILEMAKIRILHIAQDEVFGDIVINKV